MGRYIDIDNYIDICIHRQEDGYVVRLGSYLVSRLWGGLIE